MKVLVTGATGNVGSHVVRSLTARGVPARAFVRDPGKATQLLGPDAELAIGEFADRDALRRAVAGTDVVFISSADHPGKVAEETAMIDTAVAQGVSHIVKMSVNGAAVDSPVGIWRWHAQVEERLRTCDVPSTVLGANFFMTNLFAVAEQVRAMSRIFAPAGNARIAMIDPADVGEAAAAVLADERQRDPRYTLTGPAALGYTDVAQTLSSAVGRPVDYVDIPDDQARGALREVGLPDWLADDMVAMFIQFRAGVAGRTTDTVDRLTGRPPRSLHEFAWRYAAVFGGTAQRDPALSASHK